MTKQEQEKFIHEFLITGNQLYNSGQFDELACFCNEVLEIINDERVQLMHEHVELAIKRNNEINNTVTFRLLNGVIVTGYKNEFVISSIFINKGFYEQNILESWFKYGVFKTVYDIGANIGNHTLFFATNSPEAQVYSFEPMPVNYKILETNISNNRLDSRVYLYNKAVGSHKDFLRMKVNVENNNGTAQITDDDSPDTEIVEVVTIDELELPVPDFIKIDTEGYEIQVLQGMRRTLEKSNAYIWIEIDTENALKVYQIMKSLGYEVIDFSLKWSSNVLFGKTTQKTYPEGYAFARLLKWSQEICKELETVLAENLFLKR